jgi:DNA-binding NarL/FixJ family response regulator
MSENNIRVLLADDHEVVLMSIKSLLEREEDIEVVGMAANGREAIQLAQTTIPDVIVMDISMPELDGIRATGKIKALNNSINIIVLSMYKSWTLLQQARKYGASAYITKQKAMSDLVPAIRAVMDGTLSL